VFQDNCVKFHPVIIRPGDKKGELFLTQNLVF